MRVKMPTDPTIPNPQDPKDAPHSHNGGDSRFMPYVPAWERLADAIRRVTAGRRPKELAQIDLCRAIADGTVKIRCKLKRHTTGFTSNAVLEGKDFHIPTEIKPEDAGLGEVTPAETMVRPTRELFDTGILGSGSGSRFAGPTLRKFCAPPRSKTRPPNMPQVRRQQAQAGRRSKARRCPLALVQDQPPGRENQVRLGQNAVAGRDRRNLSRPRTP